MTDDKVNLDKFISSASVTVQGSSILNAINLHNNLHLNIKLEKASSLVLNIFDYADDLECHIDVELEDESSFILNNSFISEIKYNISIDTKLYGNDALVMVNVRGINNEHATSLITMNGTVAGGIKDASIYEYAKVINKSDNSAVLIPNLIVNTNEVEANHGVSIGSLDPDELFYLMSKGLSESDARKLIENGFLLSIMGEEERFKIQNILMGR